MARARLSLALACSAALAGTLSLSTLAATTAPGTALGIGHSIRSVVPMQATPNWAGYVVTADSTAFTSVTATWKQPTVACTSADPGAAVSFWVGLGGSNPGVPTLEQTGTASECSSSGSSTYHAWYEIVPGSPVAAGVKISPGDTITASVNIVANGTTAIFQIKNRTTKRAFTTHVALTSPPDVSSADWIVEAPTECAQSVCLPVPLQWFKPISFSRVAALGNGIGGTLTHLAWIPDRLELVPSTVLASSPSNAGAGAGAVTTGLTPDGGSFEVLWTASPPGLNTAL